MALSQLVAGLQLNPMPPRRASRDTSIPHAPIRTPLLNEDEKKQALKNALRYFPASHQQELVSEFSEELRDFGHIYMYRFLPSFDMRAYPISEYPCKCLHAAGIMHMIMNNLDKRVAQYPQELVTYGGNGQVFSNWAQFWITMKYLSEMTEEQTLVMCSGHPQGLFPSSTSAPRAVISNGMVIPNYSSKAEYDKMFALGVTMYGQMTAGSYCYIGPQGIVHGTTLTIINAGRRYLSANDLAGKVLITSGLGGMSGAQAKAAVIAGCVGVVAEIDKTALTKRYEQGWLMHQTDDLEECVNLIRKYRKEKSATSIGYLGGIVDLWERIAAEYENTGELLVELGSDQTSCHDPYGGGYYPAGMSFEESQSCLTNEPHKFKDLVQQSLRRHVAAINKLSAAGMYFWDYGNAFLLEAGRLGADVFKNGSTTQYKYPSYVQHIMGDIFSLGFGPFRWVCTSGKDGDLQVTDDIATQALEKLIQENPKTEVLQQYKDNLKWIKGAGKHCLVVGSKARILYADCKARTAISCAFNEAVKGGVLSAPVIISRDHHDVSGTDSPYRETSNIYDGSSFCADMAVQNCIGDSFRGATWVAIHNGGGVGWGEVINGGFGLILDGSNDSRRKAETMLHWDVNNGGLLCGDQVVFVEDVHLLPDSPLGEFTATSKVARRSWSGNTNAFNTIKLAMAVNTNLKVTLPNPVDDEILFKSG